jgi:hypothetical protein
MGAGLCGKGDPVATDHATPIVGSGQQGTVSVQGDQLVADPQQQRTISVRADRDTACLQPTENVIPFAGDPRGW